MITILIVLAVLMLLGAIPTWPHSRNWGTAPVVDWASSCSSSSSCS